MLSVACDHVAFFCAFFAILIQWTTNGSSTSKATLSLYLCLTGIEQAKISTITLNPAGVDYFSLVHLWSVLWSKRSEYKPTSLCHQVIHVSKNSLSLSPLIKVSMFFFALLYASSVVLDNNCSQRSLNSDVLFSSCNLLAFLLHVAV